jgi:hypothetical protein
MSPARARWSQAIIVKFRKFVIAAVSKKYTAAQADSKRKK